MKTNAEVKTVAEGFVLVIIIASFFFDIVGVFGLAFAITGMLIAFGSVIAICLKRPSEDQTR
jgi:Na+/H+-translocating membrane pyrophosphatase